MDPILELTLALLASVGLLFLGWALFERLLHPKAAPGAPCRTVVRGEGNGAGLEYTVNALFWSGEKEVILLDAGLNGEGRQIALLLQRRWPRLVICTPEELAEQIA